MKPRRRRPRVLVPVLVVSDQVLIQARRLDLLRPDRSTLPTLRDLLQHGPRHVALARSSV